MIQLVNEIFPSIEREKKNVAKHNITDRKVAKRIFVTFALVYLLPLKFRTTDESYPEEEEKSYRDKDGPYPLRNSLFSANQFGPKGSTKKLSQGKRLGALTTRQIITSKWNITLVKHRRRLRAQDNIRRVAVRKKIYASTCTSPKRISSNHLDPGKIKFNFLTLEKKI